MGVGSTYYGVGVHLLWCGGPPAMCCAGSIQDVKWESVQVGQVLQANDDELFPADLMCLYTALPDKASSACMTALQPTPCL